MKVHSLIYVILLVKISWCAENSVSINVKNAVNIISDRFISYEIPFCDLMNLYHEQNSLKNLSVISPAFVKLRGFYSYLKNTENKKFKESEVSNVMEILK